MKNFCLDRFEGYPTKKLSFRYFGLYLARARARARPSLNVGPPALLTKRYERFSTRARWDFAPGRKSAVFVSYCIRECTDCVDVVIRWKMSHWTPRIITGRCFSVDAVWSHRKHAKTEICRREWRSSFSSDIAIACLYALPWRKDNVLRMTFYSDQFLGFEADLLQYALP